MNILHIFAYGGGLYSHGVFAAILVNIVVLMLLHVYCMYISHVFYKTGAD